MKRTPLAELIRPTSFDDIVGQTHLFGKNGVVRRLCDSGRIPNMIFFGPMARRDHWTLHQTYASRGFYRDANGSLLTLVTHKNDIRPMGGTLHRPAVFKDEAIYEFKPARAKDQIAGVYEIQTGGGSDVIFRDADEIECQSNEVGI